MASNQSANIVCGLHFSAPLIPMSVLNDSIPDGNNAEGTAVQDSSGNATVDHCATIDNGVTQPAPTGTTSDGNTAHDAFANFLNPSRLHDPVPFGIPAEDIISGRYLNRRPQVHNQGNAADDGKLSPTTISFISFSLANYSSSADPNHDSMSDSQSTAVERNEDFIHPNMSTPHMGPADQGSNHMVSRNGPHPRPAGPVSEVNMLPEAFAGQRGFPMAYGNMPHQNLAGQGHMSAQSFAGQVGHDGYPVASSNMPHQHLAGPVSQGNMSTQPFGGNAGYHKTHFRVREFPSGSTPSVKVRISPRFSTPVNVTIPPKSAGAGPYVHAPTRDQPAEPQTPFGVASGPEQYPARPQQPAGGQPSGYQPSFGFGHAPRQYPSGLQQPSGNQPFRFQGPNSPRHPAGSHQPGYSTYGNSNNMGYSNSTAHGSSSNNSSNNYGPFISHPGACADDDARGRDSRGSSPVPMNLNIVGNNNSDINVDIWSHPSTPVDAVFDENQQHHHRSHVANGGSDGQNDEPQQPSARFPGNDNRFGPRIFPGNKTWEEIMDNEWNKKAWDFGVRWEEMGQDVKAMLESHGLTYSEVKKGNQRIPSYKESELLRNYDTIFETHRHMIVTYEALKKIREGTRWWPVKTSGVNNSQPDLMVGMARTDGQIPVPSAQEAQPCAPVNYTGHAHQDAASEPAIASGPANQALQGFPPGPAPVASYPGYPGTPHQDAAFPEPSVATSLTIQAEDVDFNQYSPHGLGILLDAALRVPEAEGFATVPGLDHAQQLQQIRHIQQPQQPQHTQQAQYVRHFQQAQEFTAASSPGHATAIPTPVYAQQAAYIPSPAPVVTEQGQQAQQLPAVPYTGPVQQVPASQRNPFYSKQLAAQRVQHLATVDAAPPAQQVSAVPSPRLARQNPQTANSAPVAARQFQQTQQIQQIQQLPASSYQGSPRQAGAFAIQHGQHPQNSQHVASFPGPASLIQQFPAYSYQGSARQTGAIASLHGQYAQNAQHVASFPGPAPQTQQFPTSYPGSPHEVGAFASQHAQHGAAPRFPQQGQQARQFPATSYMSPVQQFAPGASPRRAQQVPATPHITPVVPGGNGSIDNITHQFRGTPEGNLPRLDDIQTEPTSGRKRNSQGINSRAAKRPEANANSPAEGTPAGWGF